MVSSMSIRKLRKRTRSAIVFDGRHGRSTRNIGEQATEGASMGSFVGNLEQDDPSKTM